MIYHISGNNTYFWSKFRGYILGPNKGQKKVNLNFFDKRGVAGGCQNYIILAKLLKVHISLILVLKVNQNGTMNETPCTFKLLGTLLIVSSSWIKRRQGRELCTD